MVVGYSTQMPSITEQVGDCVEFRYGIAFEEATEDVPARYRFEYVRLPIPADTPANALYYYVVAAITNERRSHDEQIGILRKYVSGLRDQLQALAAACGKTLPDNQYEAVFGTFDNEVESVKSDSKQELGLE